MKLYSFRYIFPQALKSMRANGWMTFAAIITITISLFLCSFFWLIIENMDANATEIEEDVRVMAYLDFGLSQDDYDAIEYEIKQIEGVKAVDFISKEDGLSSLENQFDDTDLLSTLGGNNPLPDTFSITAQSTDYVKPIYLQVQNIEGILKANYGEVTVEKLFTLTDTLRIVGIAIMALLAIAAVVLIAMAIRLTIVSRKKEIMVMKWCGATDAFVRWPFFIEGIILGVGGSLFALIISLLLYGQVAEYLSSTISFIEILSFRDVWAEVTLFILSTGLILGAIGSLLPLTRFLKV